MSKSVFNRLPEFFFNAVTTDWTCRIRFVIVSLAILTVFQSLFRSFAIVSCLEPIILADSTYCYATSSGTSNWWARSGIPSIYCQALSRKEKVTPAIHIIPFRVFVAVVLLPLVTGFLIWTGLVISSTTGKKGLADSKGTMRPADAEGLTNAEELVVICYK